MATQSLDVRVTEQGTAVVVSKLEGLEAKLGTVAAAQDANTAATERAAKSLGEINKSVTEFLERQNKKLAVVEKVAGILAKLNLAMALVAKAYELGKQLVGEYILKMQDLAPALEKVNSKLRDQAGILDAMIKTRNKFALAGATIVEAAQAGGRAGAILGREAEILEAQAEAERVRKADRARQAGPGYGAGGLPVSGAVDAANAAGATLDALRLAELEQAVERLNFANRGDQLANEKLAADIKAREEGGPAGIEPKGGGWARPVSGNQGGQSGFDPLETASLLTNQLGTQAESASFAAQQIDTLAESWARATGQASAFAEATGKAALASAVAAAAMGGNVFKALAAVLKGRAIEAGVEALWAYGKAAFYATTNPVLSADALAAAGFYTATAAAAGAGGAIAGGLAGGGGGGGSAPARGPSQSDFAPRRVDASAGGNGAMSITINNNGLSLSTDREIAAQWRKVMKSEARSPGMVTR